MDLRRKITPLLAAIFSLVVVGASGFHLLEGWDWLDSFYATVVTLGTVGYGDFHPVTPAGKLFCMGLIIVGLGVISYAVLELTAFVVEGHLNRLLTTRRVDKLIKRLKGHYIVCGAGKTGRHVVEELIKNQVPFVVVDKSPEALEWLLQGNHPHLVGDATDDSVLARAGIRHARGLAAALDTDELNLFLVLTAKNLNHALRCVTKCIHETARGKLARAGADAVVAPNIIGGLRIASERSGPNVVTFLDVMLRESKGVRVEEATLPEGSPHAGRTLADLKLMERLGLQPIAIREGGKHFLYNPPPDHRLKAHDTLVVISEPEKLARLKQLLKSR